MDLAVNLAEYNSNVFSENMGHPQPIKNAIIKKGPKLLIIYGITPLQSLLLITTNSQD